MYSDSLLLLRDDHPARVARKVPLGDTLGRDEAWLRDTLHEHPGLLPINDLDDAFGPVAPLCRELRTEAGPLDIAYISPTGRLTLVECKLWRNPEARRKVVAQVLDYARALSRWSYSDLQRQVSMASREAGNIPYLRAMSLGCTLAEHHFADAVTRNMRNGRFLLLIAGDGIREDVSGLTDLINRNATSAFSLGLIEVALYDLGAGELAVQPRVVARTSIIERQVVLFSKATDGATSLELLLGTMAEETTEQEQQPSAASSSKFTEQKEWWAPVVAMRFDDPEQEPPRVHYPNHVRLPLPWPGVRLMAYRAQRTVGVFLTGRSDSLRELLTRLQPDIEDIRAELPAGTTIPDLSSADAGRIGTTKRNEEFKGDDSKRWWIIDTLNSYVNVIRPRLRRLMETPR